VYGENLVSQQDQSAYESDQKARIDPRMLEPGDACVVRMLAGAGVEHFGLEYGARVVEPPDNTGKMVVQTRRASLKNLFKLPLLVGEDTYLLSFVIPPRVTGKQGRSPARWDPNTVVEFLPPDPQRVIGYVLSEDFKRKPIKPLPESK
jgi:hypothetical protein